MSLLYYIEDAGPVTADVFDTDGITPIEPQSATATIVNLHTNEVVIDDGACDVGEGFASYIIPDGSLITATSARYVAYIRVVIDATTINTVSVPFDVLDKASYFIVDRWRRKVEFAAPNEDALNEQEGRDWIDQAVAYLNGRYTTGYTSVLASLTPDAGFPAAGASTIELIASVGGLMARTAWWAGKGNWRDEEMSLDTGPFQLEWARLSESIEDATGWFTAPAATESWDMSNRDGINQGGISQRDYPYWNRWVQWE